MLLYMVLNPLWPAYGEAFSRGDFPWVRKTLLRSLRVALLVGVPTSAALVLCGQWFIRVWTGDAKMTPTWPLLIAFGLWSVSNVITGAVGMLLNGANRMRFHMTVHALMAVVNVALSIALAKAVGLAGVLYGTVLSQVLVILIPSAIYVPRLLARLERERKDPPPEQPFATTLAPVTAQ
jgi:O-antigen/teichoic acid export membrane protein